MIFHSSAIVIYFEKVVTEISLFKQTTPIANNKYTNKTTFISRLKKIFVYLPSKAGFLSVGLEKFANITQMLTKSISFIVLSFL